MFNGKQRVICARFGRAVRGPGQQGTGILLVEKKDTDDGREQKAANLAKRQQKIATAAKRKAGSDKSGRASKRPALINRTSIVNEPEQASDSEEPTTIQDSVESLKEERRKHYETRLTRDGAVLTRKEKVSDKKVVEGSAMDDFINVNRTFKCRRIVLMIFFGNDKRCACIHRSRKYPMN